MSILTLNKFLLNRGQGTDPASAETPSAQYLDVASRTITAIRRSVLGGETFADLFEEMDSIRKELLVESGREAIGNSVVRVEDVLAKYQTRLRQADQDRAADFKKVLDILNEVLRVLTDDSQQSDEKRKQLETDLTSAARVDDISTLRSHLARILLSVRNDGRRERDKAQEVIATLGQHIQQVHKAQSRFISHLPGRNNAIECLKPMVEAVPAPLHLRIAMFAADSLRVIRERHGEEVANAIVHDLGLKQLQPLFPDGKIFRWSPNALLVIWQEANDAATPGDILARLQPSYEQRAFVGNRIAVFTLQLRSLVVQSHGNMEDLVFTFDRFSRGGGGAC